MSERERERKKKLKGKSCGGMEESKEGRKEVRMSRMRSEG